MAETMIETYERQQRELLDMQMAETRARLNCEREAATAALMGGVLASLAESSLIAAVFVSDTKYGAKCAADSMRYQMLSAAAYAGLPAENIIDLMKEADGG